jgi:DNA-binding XRE family transcriptional regulator
MARTLFYDSETDTWGSKELIHSIRKERKYLKRIAKNRKTNSESCPSAADIKAARLKAGYTLPEAADAVYVERKTWLSWEYPEEHVDNRKMHPAFAELFALKSGLIKIEDICPHLVKLNGKD